MAFIPLVLLFATRALAAGLIPSADPFKDPKNDPFNPLRYITSNVLTGIAVALVLCVAILQSIFTWRLGAKWMLSMVIGGYTFALGLAIRFGLHEQPRSKGLYIVEYLFVVLSPCAFIAADYVLLGRLAKHIGAGQYLLVSPRRLTAVFITSDISTFLIQAAGGSLTVSANAQHRALIGSRIFLGGLAAQFLSFLIFTFIYCIFLLRVYKRQPQTWKMDEFKPWYQDWRALAFALCLSCVGILIRSGFRVVELSEGFRGRLATSEAFFYGLDTLPLFLATSVYVPFWPGRFINNTPSSESSVDNIDEK